MQAGNDAPHPELEPLLARITSLENDAEREKKSLLRRVGLWGGTVALFLSILTGGFTLYEKSFVAPATTREAKLDILTQIVSQLSTIDERAARARAGGGPIFTSLNAEVLSLLGRADAIIDQYRNDIRIVDIIVISHWNLQFGRHQRAFDYATLAYMKAHAREDKFESLRVRGKAQFPTGPIQNVPRARKDFLEALSLSEQLDQLWKTQFRYSLYNDWVTMEAHFGECANAKRLLQEWKTIVESIPPNKPPNMAAHEWQQISNMLGQITMGSQCPVGTVVPFGAKP